ncbi:hypothetical protein [Hymenobacter negativus]|uniref:ATP-binding protein n=1 Tax=Hymenobacter negativus TaxID=2795026 RepID=A0ABS3QEJ3_9BACT|nr:hypothetical protein [Hymenobacter negativus]MBO2009234.1 hypothetical protein [Hymenobacter negativus]
MAQTSAIDGADVCAAPGNAGVMVYTRRWLLSKPTKTIFGALIRALAPELRQHLYLVFKEAVTNAVRHARHATTLRVSLARHAGPLERGAAGGARLEPGGGHAVHFLEGK